MTDDGADDINDGDRFEALQPTGDAGALLQVVAAEPDGEGRIHVFNVDDPTDIRTVHRDRLLDGLHYRKVTPLGE